MCKFALLWLFLVALVTFVRSDTPANCTFESIRGAWTFSIGQGGGDNTINCTADFKPVSEYDVVLYFPDVAFDQYGNQGRWTLIYNQGFEVRINKKRFFAFSKYTQDGKKVTSYCSQTFPGWVHDDDERNWACYSGQKKGDEMPKQHQLHRSEFFNNWKYKSNAEFIQRINKHQKSWTATVYPEYSGMMLSDMTRRSGGRRSADAFPKTARVLPETQKVADRLPKNFDWRDVNGQNFVSPVRNQKTCGSCYAFGSMALHEARLRIATNNTVQKVFSTQDIVSCSEYSQGCDGGFPYLIAGKYGQDFGLIEDSCFTYKAKDVKCITTTCPRYYTRDYYYVGGFYGGCNEALMRIEVAKYGPVAVSFQVYPDFQHYKSGIYHHTELLDRFNPWEITNHVVLIVGYGQDADSGEKYWIVKNSWGETWGEEGFFRISRGNDECSIESMVVGTLPIL
ncbi:hypothetical protein LOTGIDRAFT_221343 [Lottia gigantea]|uniref:Dipeptidyl peptidase 1 n=1 Tax=Lottia gigantea TaxID=225164 RepID=V4B8Z0_LOTGI|nr:hypothetical protein LOTGIDRAFT_221343 [Lottia gigantea]ESO85314.1 hypothetical protein LOTGIDRAFT_221343 [Lottia gigantea]